ncbi:MAG TPA: DUF5709 domain-containing protein [Trebonia sp.]
MPGKNRHESEDLRDYEVLDGSDTLDGNPGDDPLDRGVATPDHWSAGLRYAAEGDDESESLDEQLSEEEPDITVSDEEDFWDENETGQEASRDEQGADADPRTGRLVSEDEDVDGDGDTSLVMEDDLVAQDVGIDGGAASAEEAAVHLTGDPEFDDDDE